MIPLRDDNPTTLPPLVTALIIVACALAFFWQLSLGTRQESAIYALGAIPAVLFGYEQLPAQLVLVPGWMTAFTSMFMHGGWMHLIGNMLYLWIFGNNIEDAMGHVRFIIFYLLCGIAALLANALLNTHSTIPMIGASGAISGVLGAYALLFPRAHVQVFVPIGFMSQAVWLPAILVLGIWFVLQIVNSIATVGHGGGGVAWAAHIGGFVAGIVLIPIFKKSNLALFNSGNHSQ
ncbi:MAG: rhomboid family intramembrane serine protease [Gammaproteobacteria bacterium]|nr:rhomboid family intramembrane serine protease [Gammaproteobacteria bacterium]